MDMYDTFIAWLRSTRTKMASQNQQITQLKAQVAALQQQVTALNAKVATLTATVASRDATIATLQSTIAARDLEIATLKARIAVLEGTVTPPPPPPPVPSTTLVEEFNAVPPSALWRVAGEWTGTGGNLLQKANVAFADGQMALTVPAGSPLRGGELQSMSTTGYSYGFYEARIKPANVKNGGVVSFFWIQQPSYGPLEIDIEFTLSDAWVGTTGNGRVSFSTHPLASTQWIDLAFNPTQGFHDYGFLWTPGRVDFTVDRQVVRTVTDPSLLSNALGYIMTNAWSGNANFGGGPPTVPATSYYEWIKHYPGATAIPGADTPTPTPVPTPTPPPTTGGTLNLPRVSWDGGPTYYAQFSKANAAGWDDPAFFPIGVWLSPAWTPSPANLKAAGVNYYMAVEHDLNVGPLSNLTAQGITSMPHGEWSPAEVNDGAVSWFTTDEPDMDMSLGDENGRLAAVRNLAATARARNDGRFVSINIGNGVCRSFWCPNTIDEMIQSVDFSAVDKYAYTSPGVRFEIERSPDWPGGSSKFAAAYGWMARQMRRFQDPSKIRPFGVMVETARPLLNESGAGTITMPQIEGAIWSALTNEARSILFFQHNNDPAVPFYSLSEPNGTVALAIRTAVGGFVAKVRSLAPVLNTQSYVWDAGSPKMDTMLKAKDGSLYLFACLGVGGATGAKTFTLPAGVAGTTAEVVGEGRSIPVTAGKFTDSFAFEYTHHVYRVAL